MTYFFSIFTAMKLRFEKIVIVVMPLSFWRVQNYKLPYFLNEKTVENRFYYQNVQFVCKKCSYFIQNNLK